MSSCACRPLLFSRGLQRHPTAVRSSPLDDLLLSNCALARALARARVRPRALTAHREAAAVARAAVAADFHQPLDVHRAVLAQFALDAALLLDDAADLPHVVLGQILHPD